MALATSSVLMARVAVDAVVHISIHIRMVEVGRVVPAMAARASEDRVVGRVGMAGGANAVGVAVIDIEERVIARRQCRRDPCRGGMAGGAGRRPARCGVIRAGSAGVVLGMARIAVGGQGCVVVVDVAQCAGHAGVRAGQRERGVVMVEGRSRPCGGAVANFAGCREAGSRVRRVVGAVVIRHVAVRAQSLRCPQGVVVVHVALHALQRGMRAGECEPGVAVVEG